MVSLDEEVALKEYWLLSAVISSMPKVPLTRPLMRFNDPD